MEKLPFIILSCCMFLTTVITTFITTELSATEITAGKEGHPIYSITIADNDRRTAHVTASMHLAKNKIRMTSWGHPWLQHGWATFVKNLKITDTTGNAVKITPIDKDGWGTWIVDAENGELLSLEYDIEFSHDQHDWFPAGGQDSRPTITEHAMFLVTKALFIYTPNIEEATIKINVPIDWNISTSWTDIENQKNTYHANSWISLVNNALVLGKHYERIITAESMQVVLAIDNSLSNEVDMFEDTFRKQLASYKKLFGSTPNDRFLVAIVAADEDDGEAFNDSFNQVVTNNRLDDRKIIWANTMGHELFHYWNGSHFLVAENKQNAEWFGEGFTEYYASLTLLRTGMIDEELYFKKLERYFGRYLITKKMWPEKALSLVEASKDKPKNWLLIYGGGATIALTLDIELRDITNGKKGLDDVMKLLYKRHGLTGKRYTVKDIEMAVSDVAGKSYKNFFDTYIRGAEAFLPLQHILAKAGLTVVQFSDEFYIKRDKNASKKQATVWSGLTGVK